MPGKRFNYRITRGPWKALRARIIGSAATAGNFLLDVQGVTLPQGGIPSVPHDWLKMLPNKTPRRRKGKKNR